MEENVNTHTHTHIYIHAHMFVCKTELLSYIPETNTTL